MPVSLEAEVDMPNVKGGNTRGVGQSHQSGYHTKEQIKQTMNPEHARDDLKGAFAGKENETVQLVIDTANKIAGRLQSLLLRAQRNGGK